MVKVKKNDFIEVEYLGRLKASNQIFDLTDEKLAKENKMHDSNFNYGPIIICIGENQILKGLDDELEDKEIGKEYKIDVPAEKGFGRKNPKLMKLVPTNVFRKQEIVPIPGLQVNLDGLIGTIRTVSGGRCIVDFNHPLAGRELVYEIKINRIIEDVNEQVKSLIKFNLPLKDPDFNIKLENENLTIETKQDIKEELKNPFIKKIKKLIPKIMEVKILKEEPQKTTTKE